MAMSCLFGNRECNACMRCVRAGAWDEEPWEGEEAKCRID